MIIHGIIIVAPALYSTYFHFLNQARAGLRPACAWFLKFDPVRIVCMCMCVFACVSVCVSAPEAINN